MRAVLIYTLLRSRDLDDTPPVLCVDPRHSSNPGWLRGLYEHSWKSPVCVTGLWSLGDECNQLYLRIQTCSQSKLSLLISALNSCASVLNGDPWNSCRSIGASLPIFAPRSTTLPHRSWRRVFPRSSACLTTGVSSSVAQARREEHLVVQDTQGSPFYRSLDPAAI